MADEDDLRLNTLHRFAKQSPRLVLQEYSHCEVPAGCGGVVLRWVDPREGVPIRVALVCTMKADVSLDGAPLPTGRAAVAPGRHVLGFRLSGPFFVTIVLDRPSVEDELEDVDAPSSSEPIGRASAGQIAAAPSWARWRLEGAMRSGRRVYFAPSELSIEVAFRVEAR